MQTSRSAMTRYVVTVDIRHFIRDTTLRNRPWPRRGLERAMRQMRLIPDSHALSSNPSSTSWQY